MAAIYYICMCVKTPSSCLPAINGVPMASPYALDSRIVCYLGMHATMIINRHHLICPQMRPVCIRSKSVLFLHLQLMMPLGLEQGSIRFPLSLSFIYVHARFPFRSTAVTVIEYLNRFTTELTTLTRF